MAMPRGRADLRHHGAADGCSWWRPAGYALLGRATCVTAERNGPDVLADERLPFGALAEDDFPQTKRCPPVLIRRTPDRAAPNLPRCDGRPDRRLCVRGCGSRQQRTPSRRFTPC